MQPASKPYMASRKTPQPSAQPFLPAERTLQQLAAALPACQGCDIYRNGSKPVAGEGRLGAGLMLVGEQPGDQEEQAGHPFVGPAGAELDRILAELKIPRDALFVTNAVKHFKFVERGKRRLHETPRTGEVSACRPWLAAEIEIVRPRVILCLGASAAKSLLGSGFSLMADRGKLVASPSCERTYATVHPSAILRAPDADRRHELHTMLKTDLERAWLDSQR